jgi:hypothetical protein
MEKQKQFFLTIPAVALGTVLLLLVPLVAMQFTPEVNWSVSDFILMGALIFGTGVLVMLALRSREQMAYRAGLIIMIGASFLMIWANLAVGLIGSGPNPGNLMYAGVIAVLLMGIYLSKFKAAGMERTMFATALALIMLTGIALLMNMQAYAGSSVLDIVGINIFFATPFIIAGLLFRYAAQQPASTH